MRPPKNPQPPAAVAAAEAEPPSKRLRSDQGDVGAPEAAAQETRAPDAETAPASEGASDEAALFSMLVNSMLGKVVTGGAGGKRSGGFADDLAKW